MDQIHLDFELRSAASQSQFGSHGPAIRGVDLTTDPVDGKQREVWTGTGATHWTNGWARSPIPSPSPAPAPTG